MSTTIFTPAAEHEDFRASVRRFAEASGDRQAVRALLEDPRGHDPAVWSQLSRQLGLPGLHLPEEHGGSGVGFRELAIVFEELGRTLLPSPYLATVMGSSAIRNAGSAEEQGRWLPDLATGERIATLAHAFDPVEGPAVEARAEGGDHRLTGTARHVLDAQHADVLVVPARLDGALALFVVEGGADGLTTTALEGIDLTRRQAHVHLDGAPAARLTGADAEQALATTLDQAAVCLAAEMLGGAQICLDMAVQYAKDRYQFGRPIGSFQAVKHRCADMLVDVECARSAVQYAAWAADEAPDELPAVAAVTASFTAQAYVDCANRNIYVHGGIGFTWEHDAHLYLRRATASRALLGDPRHHRARLAGQLLDA